MARIGSCNRKGKLLQLQVIEELEEKRRSISNAKLEFLERFGQFFEVYVQASPDFRRFPEDLDNMFVKNEDGETVPYSEFLKIVKKQGLNEINRYPLYPTAVIQGAPAAGYSSGKAIKAIQ